MNKIEELARTLAPKYWERDIDNNEYFDVVAYSKVLLAELTKQSEPVYQVCKTDSMSLSSAWIDVTEQTYNDAGLYKEYGRRISGDSRDEAIAGWNKRASKDLDLATGERAANGWPMKGAGSCACKYERKEDFGEAVITEQCGYHAQQSTEIATLTAKLAESEKQLAEAMKDAERIEWLHKSFFDRKWNGVVGSGESYIWSIYGDYRHVLQQLKQHDFRNAIDAAIRTMKEE